MDTKQEFVDLCDKMSKEIVQPFLRPKEHIYVDSDLLYYYRLGAMIGLTKTEQQFNYVVSHVQDYIKAPSLDCARFFPEMGLTDEMLDKFIQAERFFNFVSAAAPASDFIDNLDKIILAMNTVNTSKEVKEPLTITINQRTIPIHPVYKRGIVNRVHSIDPRVNVEFVAYKSWYEVPPTLIEKQDFICVYDLGEFLREGTNSQKLLAEVPSKLSRCYIASLLQSDKPNPTPEQFTNLKAILEVMCDKFMFVEKTILNGELING